MDRLDRLVLLAGRNGSGKSRLLKKVEMALGNQPTPQNESNSRDQLQWLESEQSRTESQLRELGVTEFGTPIDVKNLDEKISQLLGVYQNLVMQISNAKAELKKCVLKVDGDLKTRPIVRFVPTHLDLRDPRELTARQILERAGNALYMGMASISEATVPKIQDVLTVYWNATHQHSDLPAEDKNLIVEEHERLQYIIKTLLGVQATIDQRNNAMLFGFPIGDANLSDGQKVLLQLAVALHCQGAKLDDVILLLDEPENHLHPGVIIEVLEILLEKVLSGQIWIATHSVSILAHFFGRPDASLWFMDQGSVRNAGKNQKIVLESLLGDQMRINRQREFLDEPEVQATYAFLTQCLLPPGVSDSKTGDPQTNQICVAIEKLYQEKRRLQILDYGAGKGRILANMIADLPESKALAQEFDYVAFDMDDTNREECESTITRAFDSAEHRWFSSHADLLSRRNKGSFHLIVLCNVLHEINPREWKALFGPDGKITVLLTEDGHMLLVEDQRMRKGENAHEFGFIVLNTVSLKDLFNVIGEETQILADEQRNGRLKSHLIPKSILKKVDNESITKALKEHSKHAKDEIQKLRNEKGTENGRAFAFWTIQYANAQLALEDRL